jgi:hypothetical protein
VCIYIDIYVTHFVWFVAYFCVALHHSCKKHSNFRYIPIKYLVNKGLFNYLAFILFPSHYYRDKSFELYKGGLRFKVVQLGSNLLSCPCLLS